MKTPAWTSAQPATFYDLTTPEAAASLSAFVQEMAFDYFKRCQAAVGVKNRPGKGDGSGQYEDLAEKFPALFDYAGEAGALVSNPDQATAIAIAACDVAIISFRKATKGGVYA